MFFDCDFLRIYLIVFSFYFFIGLGGKNVCNCSLVEDVKVDLLGISIILFFKRWIMWVKI